MWNLNVPLSREDKNTSEENIFILSCHCSAPTSCCCLFAVSDSFGYNGSNGLHRWAVLVLFSDKWWYEIWSFLPVVQNKVLKWWCISKEKNRLTLWKTDGRHYNDFKLYCYTTCSHLYPGVQLCGVATALSLCSNIIIILIKTGEKHHWLWIQHWLNHTYTMSW